ncbi:MAG: ABC transporter ATP-binding protein [Nitrospirota bacterium]|nr:MAG: ABC transporter ATP-binding protein [Nitrospirota bacterium]
MKEPGGILKVSDISFSYGNGKAVNDLNMSVEGGTFTAVIGANGSGKSTILKLAAGILKPASGSIELWGQPLESYKGRDRAKLISYLPQLLDINVPFKVRELINMGLYPYDIRPEMTTELAMSMVGLDGKSESVISELSGGERRRVFIAMTLLQGAGILLLDEPLANLDIQFQIEFIKLLEELRSKRSISVVMALHDINMAFHFDKLIVIRNGEVIASGDPRSTITSEMILEAFGVKVKIYHQDDGTISFGY